MLIVTGILLVQASRAAAQEPGRAAPPPAAIAFVGATLVPMDREGTVAGRTVIVRDGRIAAVGPTDSVAVPDDAMVIDASGRYLVPGLADMHVHLVARPREPAFRDAPLYLANGVTTVLNLSGDSIHLAWRDRIARGTLLGPTLYTSGRFVNEPRVETPDEVEREVRAQAAAGFDVIKFREVTDSLTRPLTTHGLSRDAYRRMMETARALDIPLTGHGPNNLGLEAVLEERQPLAHLGYALLATWFWPRETARFRTHERIGTGAVGLLAAIVAIGLVAGAVLRRQRDAVRPLSVATAVAAIVLAAAFLGRRALWDVDRVGEPVRAMTVTVAGVAVAIGAVLLIGLAVRAWRGAAPAAVRAHATAAALVTGVLAVSALVFWIPVGRRATDSSLTALGRDVARSGISVITTIQVYRSSEVASNPEVGYVRVPRWWEPFRDPPPARRAWARGIVALLQRTAGALHRAGVPLIAGTDVMWAFVIPGFALHDELALLEASGISRLDVLRTATVEAARFLGRRRGVRHDHAGAPRGSRARDGQPARRPGCASEARRRDGAGPVAAGDGVGNDAGGDAGRYAVTAPSAAQDRQRQRLDRVEVGPADPGHRRLERLLQARLHRDHER